ncbi:MAG: class I SAM-dependent methyltransferase [Lachnospiraceae bacterium]|nr:class I SAM-dependent methyltransferase [Lachnospiraceae bacterium]MDE6980252.1 class I SAM-dependent methyltransferase [Lachnospiraceae bacterium]
MEAYSGFAEVYDLFMDNVPYEIWGEYLLDRLLESGIRDGLILDLGCGTGKMTRFLAKAGYDMIGLDVSQEMLGIAAEKESEGKPILYLNQDMREFELYGTVRAVVSVCDALNYLTEQEDLLRVFRLVNNYLDPGGIFIFDMNTIYKYEVVLGENTICENREECSFIWENYYDAESRINEYDMTFFVRGQDGRYEKFQETHYQKGYDLKEIRALLEMAGLEFVACLGEDSLELPREDCERVYFIARECKKSGSRGIWKSEIVNA